MWQRAVPISVWKCMQCFATRVSCSNGNMRWKDASLLLKTQRPREQLFTPLQGPSNALQSQSRIFNSHWARTNFMTTHILNGKHEVQSVVPVCMAHDFLETKPPVNVQNSLVQCGLQPYIGPQNAVQECSLKKSPIIPEHLRCGANPRTGWEERQ